MDYIVFDLEWNQAAYKSDEEAEIPFEIIEIGAVKLDSDFKEVDTFHALIRPQVYPFLLRRTKEITGWTDEDLDTRGIYFEDACEKFLKFCGRNYIFCTWGPGDVTQLERNMAYYKIKNPWKYPNRYLDVQKLYALQNQEGKLRRTLEFAIESMEIPVDGAFHHAIEDAKYTAKIFQKLDLETFESYFSIDYFRIPKNRFEEKTFYFDTYSKFVSRSFPLKEEVMQSHRVKEFCCYLCKKKMKTIITWFGDNGHSYTALGRCKEHGLMRGKIRIRTTEDYLGSFAVRTVKACSEEDGERIKLKKEHLTERRKEHRIRTNRNKKEALKKSGNSKSQNSKFRNPRGKKGLQQTDSENQ